MPPSSRGDSACTLYLWATLSWRHIVRANLILCNSFFRSTTSDRRRPAALAGAADCRGVLATHLGDLGSFVEATQPSGVRGMLCCAALQAEADNLNSRHDFY